MYACMHVCIQIHIIYYIHTYFDLYSCTDVAFVLFGVLVWVVGRIVTWTSKRSKSQPGASPPGGGVPTGLGQRPNVRRGPKNREAQE